jgi:hypothetical protein
MPAHRRKVQGAPCSRCGRGRGTYTWEAVSPEAVAFEDRLLLCQSCAGGLRHFLVGHCDYIAAQKADRARRRAAVDSLYSRGEETP